jgi:hypothetical protein
MGQMNERLMEEIEAMA